MDDASTPAVPVAGPPRRHPYHRLLRNSGYAWWRPVFGTMIVLTGWFATSMIVIGAAVVLHPDPEGTVSWAGLLALNLSLAVLIPLTVLVARWLHRQPAGLISSVQPRLRWRLLATFAGVAVLAQGALVVAAAALPLDFADEFGGPAGDAVAVITVVLLTTALQSAGEEYFFRGYLLQALGSFVRHPAFAIVGTALLFAMVHGLGPDQKPLLFLDRFAFGLVAGWLAVRTGGLEAGIAMHAVNNIVTFVFAALTDQLSDSLNATDAPWTVVALDVGKFVAFGLAAAWIARRRGITTTAELPPAPAPQWPYPPPFPDPRVPDPRVPDPRSGAGWPSQPPGLPWAGHPPGQLPAAGPQPGMQPGRQPGRQPGVPPGMPPGRQPGVPPEQRRD